MNVFNTAICVSISSTQRLQLMIKRHHHYVPPSSGQLSAESNLAISQLIFSPTRHAG